LGWSRNKVTVGEPAVGSPPFYRRNTDMPTGIGCILFECPARDTTKR